LAEALFRIGSAAFLAVAATAIAPWPGQGGAWAQDSGEASEIGGQVRHVSVTLFKSRTMKFDRPFATAVIGSPDIADILPMTDSQLYIQGKKVGTTNISVFDAKKQLVAVVDLEIVPDTGTLHSKIESSTGGSGIRVSSANGQVVLSGEASDAVAAARAVEVAKGLSPSPVIDAMKIASSQQVMLKVRILEVDRNASRDLGVNWQTVSGKRVSGVSGSGGLQTQQPSFNNLNQTSTTGAPVGGLNNVPFNSSAATTAGLAAAGVFPGAASATVPFGSLLANVVNTGGVSIDSLISALETQNLVKSLAEPDLIALSGDSASFLAGGSIPVPTVQPGSGGAAPTISVQYKDFGVELDFTPTVLNNGLINLKLAPSVTEVNTANSVLVNGTTIPQLTKRSATTTIELRDGQSFAIAGLLQAGVNEDISQLPWLGSIPVLGALFRSTGFQKNETELVIIVSPHLVRPAPPGQRLATPFDHNLQSTDAELFLMGEVERKKKYTEYVTSGGDIKGPYGHILRAQ
jgi:pilus assembly protein CpaC